MLGHDFNHRLIFKILGSLLLVESVFIASAILVAFYYNEPHIAGVMSISSGICVVTGLISFFLGRKAKPELGKREGSVIVASAWLLFSVFGMIPFILSGSIPSVTDAFFETMSGFTTTGASILNNIEELPYGILYWRSLTHWIGGLGIIVISMAILPIFGYSGMQIFSAEATGPTKEKIHPKLSETAKILLYIYIALTATETVLLRLAGMSWFDAVCHSFGTIATGGFSTKQASIAFYNSPAIEYVIIVFMMFSGFNFSLFYFLVKLKIDKVIRNEEFRTYIILIAVFTILLTLSNTNFSSLKSVSDFEQSLRQGLFVTTSTITTTGFVTVNYGLWPVFSWFLVIILMLIGSSAGSTAGGMKVVRVLLVFKHSYLEFKRLIHPNAVFPVQYNRQVVPENIITRVLAFIILYFIITIAGSAVLSLTKMNFIDSLSGMITCLSNVGPALGNLGPAENFFHLPDFSKWFLAFTMMIGRLEIFTVLLVFTPTFWKN
jgi:trk system potassium uptake protein TrkH